jgi:uncharacterized membrane protein YfcA
LPGPKGWINKVVETILEFYLILPVFIAALLQTVTGVGYGVIAGPVLLAALDSSEAFQVVTLHNLMIALAIVPSQIKNINFNLLKSILLGAVPGILIGFTIQLSADLWVLKALSTTAILIIAGTLAQKIFSKSIVVKRFVKKKYQAIPIGFSAGLLGGMLAMPGPVLAAWMSIHQFKKLEIRATILAFFIFAYGANGFLYFYVESFDKDIVWLSGVLSLPLIGGILIGNWIIKIISEEVFQLLLLFVLLGTAVFLLISIFV